MLFRSRRAARERCDCWPGQVTSRLLAEARIPRRYQHCDFANFRDYSESLKRAKTRAAKLADAFPAVDRGLFLEGPPGVGKTHLAVAVLRQVVAASSARAVFYDTRDLLRVIRSTYDPVVRTTEIEVLRPVMQADLLVLDDLRAEKTTEWVEETLNLIVNTRYNERRVTVLTSNYPDIPDETDTNSLLFSFSHYALKSLVASQFTKILRSGRLSLGLMVIKVKPSLVRAVTTATGA